MKLCYLPVNNAWAFVTFPGGGLCLIGGAQRALFGSRLAAVAAVRALGLTVTDDGEVEATPTSASKEQSDDPDTYPPH